MTGTQSDKSLIQENHYQNSHQVWLRYHTPTNSFLLQGQI